MGKAKANTAAAAQEAGRELAKSTTVLDRIRDKEISGVVDELSFDQLLDQLRNDGELKEASDLGEGYHLVQGKESKAKFVDVPFVILNWRVNEKWKYGPGVSLNIKTAVPVVFEGKAYSKFILNDGSTGIAAQMMDYIQQGKTAAILCRRGLTRSDYEVTDKDGEPIIDPATNKPVDGTTFYLNTAL